MVAGALTGSGWMRVPTLTPLRGSVGRKMGLRQSEGWAVRAELPMRGSVALVL